MWTETTSEKGKVGSNKKIRMKYEWTRKIIEKTPSKKQKKNSTKQSEIAAGEQKTISEKWKFGSNKKLGLEWTMNGLGKPFKKNLMPKNKKNSRNQNETDAC